MPWAFRCCGRLASWVAMAAMPWGAAWAGNPVTSISTTEVTMAPPQTRSGIGSDSGTLSVTYDGQGRIIQSFVAGGQTYTPVLVGEAIARRNTATPAFPLTNPNQAAAWNTVVSVSGSDHTVSGQYLNTMDSLFTSRNTRTGTENLFVNTSPNAGDVVNNIERMDFVFTTGLTAAANVAFAVMERGHGPGGGGTNGGFKVAAITGLNASKVPTAFSNIVVSVTDDSYNNGGAGVVASSNYDVFRYATAAGPHLDYMNNVDIGPQGFAGMSLAATEFVSAGTTIYGYAVFGEDVTATGANLVDWTNSTFFVTNSPFTNDMDMVASGAVLYRVIPEPSSAVLLLFGGILLRLRRPARR